MLAEEKKDRAKRSAASFRNAPARIQIASPLRFASAAASDWRWRMTRSSRQRIGTMPPSRIVGPVPLPTESGSEERRAWWRGKQERERWSTKIGGKEFFVQNSLERELSRFVKTRIVYFYLFIFFFLTIIILFYKGYIREKKCSLLKDKILIKYKKRVNISINILRNTDTYKKRIIANDYRELIFTAFYC